MQVSGMNFNREKVLSLYLETIYMGSKTFDFMPPSLVKIKNLSFSNNILSMIIEAYNPTNINKLCSKPLPSFKMEKQELKFNNVTALSGTYKSGNTTIKITRQPDIYLFELVNLQSTQENTQETITVIFTARGYDVYSFTGSNASYSIHNRTNGTALIHSGGFNKYVSMVCGTINGTGFGNQPNFRLDLEILVEGNKYRDSLIFDNMSAAVLNNPDPDFVAIGCPITSSITSPRLEYGVLIFSGGNEGDLTLYYINDTTKTTVYIPVIIRVNNADLQKVPMILTLTRRLGLMPRF